MTQSKTKKPKVQVDVSDAQASLDKVAAAISEEVKEEAPQPKLLERVHLPLEQVEKLIADYSRAVDAKNTGVASEIRLKLARNHIVIEEKREVITHPAEVEGGKPTTTIGPFLWYRD